MKWINHVISRIISKSMYSYSRLVYHSSQIRLNGLDTIREDEDEKVVFVFWHGDSFCLYPAFSGHELSVITTINRRGDFIADACRRFGYRPVRLPDEHQENFDLLAIVRMLSNSKTDLAIALDGPLGPYHIPKEFPIVMAHLLKRKIVPITVNVKRKVVIKHRWDDFKIPLPGNEIELVFHQPIRLKQADKYEKYFSVMDAIKRYS
ncbi:DUF374 domain-containing protein [Eubacteriaceae bacterium ES3]|nr:DUF374 domain-containing protein [Eubacteriaceae bacterium ES3]